MERKPRKVTPAVPRPPSFVSPSSCRTLSADPDPDPMKSDGIRKLYHSISEVAALADLEAHVLRYWETEFEELAPKKNRAGNRVYVERDIEVVMRIRTLLREDKYTIEGARQVLAREAEPPVAPDREALQDLRAFLAKLRAGL